MRHRAGRGSLSGRMRRREDQTPNFRGVITVEIDLRAGERLRLAGWTRETPDGTAWISIECQHESVGSRGTKAPVLKAPQAG